VNDAGEFASDEVMREHWAQTGLLRLIVKNAFERAQMHRYGPNSFRHMLTHVCMKICKTPHELKAWSQNFGHSDVLTTLSNYGKLMSEEQIDVIEKLSGT